jgi:DNA-binding NarL/FixJ family response regulator
VTLLRFVLVDHKRPRAAAIATALRRHRGVSVSESMADLAEPIPGHSVALVADEPDSVRRTVEGLRRVGIRAKVIAYAEDPSHHGMVRAMAAGAVDYLHWPCDPTDIVAAATAATAGPPR